MTLISGNIGTFISLDKDMKDNVRPEVKVSVASVYPEKIDINEKQGVANCTFKADGAKFPFGGYIAINDPVFKVIEKAHEKSLPLVVRFEKARKKNVDPSLSIEEITATMDIARDNIVRLTVGVFDYNTNKWLLSQEAHTLPTDDPENISSRILSLNYDANDFFNNSSESKPKSVNPNKEKENCENAIVSMYIFIKEQELANGFTLSDEKRRKLAINLVKMANLIQIKANNLSGPVYSDYSHTRARFLLFKWIETTLPLNEETFTDMKKWSNGIIDETVNLWSWSKENANQFFPEQNK